MKGLKLIFISLFILLLTGCSSDALRFKNEYEDLNKDEQYRKVSISNRNPFVYKEVSDIVKMMENKETFVVYFGFSKCPWCRSMIEELITSAKDFKVKKIYYVDVLDVRDTLKLKDGMIQIEKEASSDYYKLLDLMGDVLDRYVVTDGDISMDANEYRIYAPNVIYVKDGKALVKTTGISSLQTSSNMELTSEMKKESYKLISDVLNYNTVCTDKTC